MHKVKIKVKRQTIYDDLISEYEMPLDSPCDMHVGDTFISIDGKKPDGICESAWETLSPFVISLAHGEGHFFGDWMKNPYSAMVSCNDGFRPVTFYLEMMEE